MVGSSRTVSSRTWLARQEIVTGERLQSLADISLVPLEVFSFHRHVERFAREMILVESYAKLSDRDLARLSSKRVLFVYTHALDGFIEHVWPQLDGESYTLLTHNSDDEIGESRVAWIEEAGAKLRRWFAQNTAVSHPKLTPLPIGIANSMWKHGNLRTLERAVLRQKGTNKAENLFVGFDPRTHPARRDLLDALREQFVDLPAAAFRRQSFASYLDDLGRHTFCICPRGNGLDTHRFWECLYLDVIPIVERSDHVEHWRRCGLPVLVIDDFREVTPERLEAELPHISRRPGDRGMLLLSHYAQLLSDAAQGSDYSEAASVTERHDPASSSVASTPAVHKRPRRGTSAH